jgi:magnesium transporter
MSEWILDLINRNKYAEVRNMLIEMNVVDIAQIVEEIDKDKLLILFRILPKEMAAGVFSYIPSELQEFIVESITDKEIKNIIDTFTNPSVSSKSM